jgi:hypothetical protein
MPVILGRGEGQVALPASLDQFSQLIKEFPGFGGRLTVPRENPRYVLSYKQPRWDRRN